VTPPQAGISTKKLLIQIAAVYAAGDIHAVQALLYGSGRTSTVSAARYYVQMAVAADMTTMRPAGRPKEVTR
jgi:hypothetical protein